MNQYGFERKLNRWLNHHHLEGDPFAAQQADTEGDLLPLVFVDRPYLHEMLGDPARPNAGFLLADRGAGKTATREMLAYSCIHGSMRLRALPVRYYDFNPLIEAAGGDLGQITLQHHVDLLFRAIVRALTTEVPPTSFDLLDDMDRALLVTYGERYGDPISRHRLVALAKAAPLNVDLAELSPVESLETLAQAITHLGQSKRQRYQSLYILVDRVDETSAGPAGAVALLKPLVAARTFLEMSHVAFKFFLPREVGEALRQEVDLRTDRVTFCTVSWTPAALLDVLNQRLVHYSNEWVQRIEELCVSSARRSPVSRLLANCENSPRTLLRLCQMAVHQHVAGVEAVTSASLITEHDVQDAVFAYQQQQEHAQSASTVAPSALPGEPPAIPEFGLYLDENSGHVWIDGERLVPPPSPHEFALLRTLYKSRPNLVSKENLMLAVWPGEAHDASSEQNLRKLVSRLRRSLRSGVQRSAFFIRVARGRGYWLDASGAHGEGGSTE